MEKAIDQVFSLSATTWGAESSLTYYCLLFPVWETSAGISVRMIEVKKWSGRSALHHLALSWWIPWDQGLICHHYPIAYINYILKLYFLLELLYTALHPMCNSDWTEGVDWFSITAPLTIVFSSKIYMNALINARHCFYSNKLLSEFYSRRFRQSDVRDGWYGYEDVFFEVCSFKCYIYSVNVHLALLEG